MSKTCPHLCQASVKKDGQYFRKSDSKTIQRFRCLGCGKRFSSATGTLCYRQNKRRVNGAVFKLLASGVSMRRTAILLKIHRTTVKRKLEFLAKKARISHQKLLEKLKVNQVQHLQFDDLITIEHTKLKPLSVSLAIDARTRMILGVQVSKIPAFGHLAALSRKKYGTRKSEHKQGLEKMFDQIAHIVHPNALVESDEHSLYPRFVRKNFPNAKHKRYKGGRGCVVGQGELKKLHRDPLFMLNHTCAMLRANINRLFRKTWCTTKHPDRLLDHLHLYREFHNTKLI